jgi:hypothetical protein
MIVGVFFMATSSTMGIIIALLTGDSRTTATNNTAVAVIKIAVDNDNDMCI